MDARTSYPKSYTSPEELVRLLEERGLAIEDVERAQRYLQYIGYYRLSACTHPFLASPKTDHRYKPNVSFGMVIRLYRFDKKLRLLIFNELEKIEVAVRAAIVDVGCQLLESPFWITEPQHFSDQSKFEQTLRLIEQELKRSKEDFIEHFKQCYAEKYPPAWMLAEILPFGAITAIYGNLKKKHVQKKISQTFGLQIAPFKSWLTSIYLKRNACCHHARVRNKQDSITPMLPDTTSHPWISLPVEKSRLYIVLCIVKYFLNIISPQNDMKDKLQILLTDFPEIDTAMMGFPTGWELETLWNFENRQN
ncbi:MAG: Abi family protein [Bacteroidaceae bacterium]|nr:Abi family protein [Bacteroidaceae bacterium]